MGGKTQLRIPIGLKSCIRDGGAVTAPSDSSCTCSTENATSATNTWYCTGNTASAASAGYFGVTTNNACRRVGANSTAAEGMWTAVVPYITKPGALCCK